MRAVGYIPALCTARYVSMHPSHLPSSTEEQRQKGEAGCQSHTQGIRAKGCEVPVVTPSNFFYSNLC